MIGRQHALLRENSGSWSVEDLQSTNGTYVNQVRVQRRDLVPGDTLRLGSDGPEMRLEFLDEASVQPTRPAALAAAAGVAVAQPSAMNPVDLPPAQAVELNAMASAGAQLAPAVPSEPPPTRPAIPPTAPSMGPTKPNAVRYSTPAVTICHSQEEVVQADVSPAVAVPEQPAEISEQEDEDPMNEEKLSLLRNLVFVMVGLVLVLVGIVISQTQDIRRDLKGMRDDAAKAVLGGGMDNKIQEVENNFSKTMDQKIEKANSDMNDKMQDAQAKFSKSIHDSMKQEEDSMMQRLKAELPGIIDKEIERQKRKILQ